MSSDHVFGDIDQEARKSYSSIDDHKRNAKQFRVLIFGLFLSMIYDSVWFVTMAQEQGQVDNGDGGKELWVRRFSLYMTYLLFFFKTIAAFVYWKTSIDFERLREVRLSRMH